MTTSVVFSIADSQCCRRHPGEYIQCTKKKNNNNNASSVCYCFGVAISSSSSCRTCGGVLVISSAESLYGRPVECGGDAQRASSTAGIRSPATAAASDGPATRRTRSRSDGAGRAERDRSDDATDGDGGGVGPFSSELGCPVRRDRAVHDRHIRQPVGPVHPAPDPVQQQSETRIHVALSGHQRLYSAYRHAGPDVRVHLLARDQEEHLVVPDSRPVAVLRAGIRLRGHRDGRRTVAGPHQTVFLPEGKYYLYRFIALV